MQQNYAKSNREEWENRGEEIVAEMVASLQAKEGSVVSTSSK